MGGQQAMVIVEVAMTLKQNTINHILEIEGGYVNDPDDSGGETNFGITERVARVNGYTGQMRDMPRPVAFDIYAARYWDAMSLDQIERLCPKVAQEMADTGVNMGVGRAAEFLQRTLNAFNDQGQHYTDLVVDMDIGPGTIRALSAFIEKRGSEGEIVLVSALNALQGAFYIDLTERRQKDEKYLYGWFLNRVA